MCNFSCFGIFKSQPFLSSSFGLFWDDSVMTICGHSLEGDSAAETFKHVGKRKSMYPTVGVHDVHVT